MITRPPANSALCAAAFLRGLPIAALQACGVMAIHSGNLWGVAATAYLINWWWVSNVRAAADGKRNWFAAGAACGSVCAVWLFR